MSNDLETLTTILTSAKVTGEYSEGDRVGLDVNSMHRVTQHKFITIRKRGQPAVQFRFDIDGNLQALETY